MVSLEALRKAKSATEKLIETARKLNVATDDLGALSFAINEEIAKLEAKRRDRRRTTLQELRDDLDVLTGYATFHTKFETAIHVVQSNIKDMEAAEAAKKTEQVEPPETEAGPWRKHKRVAEECRKSIYENETTLVDYIDHLVSELAEKDKRIAELDIAYYHVNNEADQLTKRIAGIEAELKDYKGEVDVLKRQHNHVFDDRERLKKRIAELESVKPVADTQPPASKPGRPHDRITLQRRIKMQRCELRRLNKKMREYAHLGMEQAFYVKGRTSYLPRCGCGWLRS
jgi:chemotaxis protein histidine kinase CheA